MSEIQEIVRACNTSNPKGVKRIQLIEWDSVDLKPFFRFKPTISSIPLKPSKTWKNIPFSKKTAMYSEPRKTDKDHGQYFAQELNFTIHGDSEALTRFSFLTLNHQYAALITFEDGSTKFIPKLKVTNRLQKSERTNTYEYSLENRSRYPARVVGNSADGSGGSSGNGAVLKSPSKLTGERYNVEGYDSRVFRTDGGTFPADGIPTGLYNLKVQFLPDPTIRYSLAEVLATEIKLVEDFFAGTLPVALTLSDAAAIPVFENFQYGT